MNRTDDTASTARAPRRWPLITLTLAVALSASGCRIQADTSFTTHKPHCAPGQSAQRMPNHQHWMWTCAPGGPAS